MKKEFFIADSHTDFLTELKDNNLRQDYIKSLSNTPLKLLSCAVFTTDDNLNATDIARLKNEIMASNCNSQLLLSVEDIGFAKTKQELGRVIDLKPISCTLTWNYDNQFSGGTYGKFALTKLGVEAVKTLEANNILVDTAHLNKKAFWHVAKITTKPIFNSHSNIYSIYRHKRNLTNKQLKAIVDTNGYLGITLFNLFIGNKKATSKDVAMQFDYLIKNFGYKNFGFGTDLYGVSPENLPLDIAGYSDLYKVAEHLKNMGHNDEVIEHIFYKNFYNFLKRCAII